MKKFFIMFLIFLLVIQSYMCQAMAFEVTNDYDVLRVLPYIIASGLVFKNADAAYSYAKYFIQNFDQTKLNEIFAGVRISNELLQAIRDFISLNVDLVTGAIKNSIISFINRLNPYEISSIQSLINVIESAASYSGLGYSPSYYVNLHMSDSVALGDYFKIFYSGTSILTIFRSSPDYYTVEGKNIGDFIRVYDNVINLRIRFYNTSSTNKRLYIYGYSNNAYIELTTINNYLQGQLTWQDYGLAEDFISGDVDNGSETVSYDLTGSISTDVLDEGQIIGSIPSVITDVGQAVNLTAEKVLSANVGILSLLQSIFTVNGSIDFSPIKTAVMNITEKFPFSLPWDFKRALLSFSSSASSGKIPISFSSPATGNVSFNIDLSIFDPVLNVVKKFEAFLYAVGLIYVTNKFMTSE